MFHKFCSSMCTADFKEVKNAFRCRYCMHGAFKQPFVLLHASLWLLLCTYCKRAYFRWGKIRDNVGKTFHVGVIFMILLIFPSYRHMNFIFAWGNFRKRR